MIRSSVLSGLSFLLFLFFSCFPPLFLTATKTEHKLLNHARNKKWLRNLSPRRWKWLCNESVRVRCPCPSLGIEGQVNLNSIPRILSTTILMLLETNSRPISQPISLVTMRMTERTEPRGSQEVFFFAEWWMVNEWGIDGWDSIAFAHGLAGSNTRQNLTLSLHVHCTVPCMHVVAYVYVAQMTFGVAVVVVAVVVRCCRCCS